MTVPIKPDSIDNKATAWLHVSTRYDTFTEKSEDYLHAEIEIDGTVYYWGNYLKDTAFTEHQLKELNRAFEMMSLAVSREAKKHG